MAKWTIPTRAFYKTGVLKRHPNVVRFAIDDLKSEIADLTKEALTDAYEGSVGVIQRTVIDKTDGIVIHLVEKIEYHFSSDRAACLFKLKLGIGN